MVNWNDTKGKLKLKFEELTVKELLQAEEKEDELMQKLATKLGKTKETLRKLISELLSE